MLTQSAWWSANTLHREIATGLLEAGKHVLCEKPLAPSVADGQAMVDRAAKSDRVAAVGFTFRRSPAINAIREQVTGGTLGPVRALQRRTTGVTTASIRTPR